MSTEIESLELKIESNSKGAVAGIEALTRTLDKLGKSTKGLSSTATAMGKIAAATKNLGSSANSTTRTYTDFANQLRHTAQLLEKTAKQIYSFIEKSSEYNEVVNLFSVSLGRYANEAYGYAENVSEVMGIDPAEWMRNQGIFMTLATGFGVASDRAYEMSTQLTQLGHDLSSFFNISVEDAMQKLQSGLSGELEPLRRIGYDLSHAQLQAVALELGIEKSISSMTQAEKAQLRYYAIMTQVTTAQGDMARTLNDPANQLRIFRAQIEQAGRAIGNIFIPLLNQALPILTAVMIVVRDLTNSIASLFGYEIPEIDYSGIESATGAVDENIEDASESAKKLKKYMMGFDELNVLSQNDTSDDLSDALSGFEFELPTYDFLAGLTESKVSTIVSEMKEWLGITDEIESWSDLFDTRLGDILVSVGAIGSGLLLWKISSGTMLSLTKIRDLLKTSSNAGIIKKGLGISLMITGFTLEGAGAFELGQGDVTLSNILKTAIGSALGIGGSLLVFGTGPLGWTVGIGLAITAFITGITIGRWEKAKEDDLAKRFGELVLSNEDIQEVVSQLTTSELSVELALFVSSEAAVADAKKAIEGAVETLNLYNFKIPLGIAVSSEEYETAVDDFVTSVKEFIESRQVTASMGISILLGETETGDRLTSFVNEFYSTSQLKLTELGTKLKQTIGEGFENGEWIPDKLKEAVELQKEIEEIYGYISDVEFRAHLNAIKLNVGDTDLSVESFEKIMSEASEVIEKHLNNLESVRLEALKVAEMEFDQNILAGMAEEEAKNIYNSTIAKIETEFRKGKIDLTVDTYEFGLDVIATKYEGELNEILPLISKSTEEIFGQHVEAVLSGEIPNDVDLLFSSIHNAYVDGLQNLDISSEARANIGRLVETLAPTGEELEKVASEALKAGETVPKNISEGLRSYNQLKAISGDMEAINYLIGEKLSTDQSFLELLLTSEGAGRRVGEIISDGLLSNLTVIEDSSNQTITLMNDTIGEKVLEVTPALVQNLKDMGYNLSEGLLIGAEEKLNSDKKSWLDWAWLPWNWFKDTNEINSPSKLFEEGGKFLATGLFNGVNGGVLESDYTLIFERISSALDGTKIKFKTIINNILGFIESMVNGVIDGVNKMINALNSFNITVPDWVTDLTGIDNFGFNLNTLSKVTIPRLAEGAYDIPSGQVFIAREAGAEMVGSIGRRTAVVNNDQIVAGIASGVANANSESNALLREQNSLLRAILEKESGTYLDGKSITKSVEKHQRERGRVVVTGGGY